MGKSIDLMGFKEARDHVCSIIKKFEKDPTDLVKQKTIKEAEEATGIVDENVLRILCNLAESRDVQKIDKELTKKTQESVKQAKSLLKAIETVTAFMCCLPEESKDPFVQDCFDRQKGSRNCLLPRLILSKREYEDTKNSTINDLKFLYLLVSQETVFESVKVNNEFNKNNTKKLLDYFLTLAGIPLSKTENGKYWNALKFVFGAIPRHILYDDKKDKK